MAEPLPTDQRGFWNVAPGWYCGDRVPHGLSKELRERFAAWNEAWENGVDPKSGSGWKDPEAGRRWIAEGDEIVRLAQAEFGGGFAVKERFHIYAPRA